jgi:hypothetical protein
LGATPEGSDVAAISGNVLWVGVGWAPARVGAPDEVTERSRAAKNTIARAGAVLGRMLGVGSGLPLALPSVSRDKCRGGRR